MFKFTKRKILTVSFYLSVLFLLSGAVTYAVNRDASNILVVPWSKNPVKIDGNIQGIRSEGGSEWWDSVSFSSWDNGIYGFLKHNGTHFLAGIIAEDTSKGSYDWIYMIFEEGLDGTRGGGTSNNQFDINSEDYKFMFFNSEIMHVFKGDGYYLGNNAWYAIGGPSFPTDFLGEMEFMSNRWEFEFAIPFAGHEGIPYDISDLTIDVGEIARWYVAFSSYSPGAIPETIWHTFPNIKWPPLDPSQMVRIYFSPFPSLVITNYIFFEIIAVFNFIGLVMIMKKQNA